MIVPLASPINDDPAGSRLDDPVGDPFAVVDPDDSVGDPFSVVDLHLVERAAVPELEPSARTSRVRREYVVQGVEPALEVAGL